MIHQKALAGTSTQILMASNEDKISIWQIIARSRHAHRCRENASDVQTTSDQKTYQVMCRASAENLGVCSVCTTRSAADPAKTIVNVFKCQTFLPSARKWYRYSLELIVLCVHICVAEASETVQFDSATAQSYAYRNPNCRLLHRSPLLVECLFLV